MIVIAGIIVLAALAFALSGTVSDRDINPPVHSWDREEY